MCVSCVFFFSSRRRHTRCALVTGVQTCALPIFWMATARLIWLLPPGRRVLRRDAARRCWREAPVVADGAADASAARHAVRSGGCAAVAAGSRPRSSDERRGGKEGVRTGRSRWAPYHEIKKKKNKLQQNKN